MGRDVAGLRSSVLNHKSECNEVGFRLDDQDDPGKWLLKWCVRACMCLLNTTVLMKAERATLGLLVYGCHQSLIIVDDDAMSVLYKLGTISDLNFP